MANQNPAKDRQSQDLKIKLNTEGFIASRKRGERENFKEYRKNLKKEAAQNKVDLGGFKVWPAYRGQALKKIVNGIKCYTNGSFTQLLVPSQQERLPANEDE